jgi:hypothetical protein
VCGGFGARSAEQERRPALYTVKQLDDLGLLRSFSRDPFRKVLAKWLKNGPTDEQIQTQAAKNPDRWAQGASMLSKMAGYSERMEVDVTGELHHVHQLSDMELDAELKALDAKLASLPQTTVIEHQPKDETA